MSNLNGGNMIVGLDIGTSKVVAIVGEINEEGGLNIIGISAFYHESFSAQYSYVSRTRWW